MTIVSSRFPWRWCGGDHESGGQHQSGVRHGSRHGGHRRLHVHRRPGRHVLRVLLQHRHHLHGDAHLPAQGVRRAQQPGQPARWVLLTVGLHSARYVSTLWVCAILSVTLDVLHSDIGRTEQPLPWNVRPAGSSPPLSFYLTDGVSADQGSVSQINLTAWSTQTNKTQHIPYKHRLRYIYKIHASRQYIYLTGFLLIYDKRYYLFPIGPRTSWCRPWLFLCLYITVGVDILNTNTTIQFAPYTTPKYLTNINELFN